MLDVSVAYNRYKFIGDEFLTWLWFLIENNPDQILAHDPEIVAFDIGNRIVIENRVNDAKETISIKGDGAGLEEGLLALKKGGVVIELNLEFKTDQLEWQFSIKGEHLSVSGLKIPPTGAVESGDDVEGIVLEKTYLQEKVLKLIDKLFKSFLGIRLSSQWRENSVPDIKKWIQSSTDPNFK
ncbi:MAG: hypothetical protein HKM93_05105 [Desulfobacteraceae bacterium]|nr:hypothetical protein [Desulfobacteraceae bacterium]